MSGVSAAVRLEIAPVLKLLSLRQHIHAGSLIVAQQGIVPVAHPVEIKIHMEARRNRLLRDAPLRDERRLRVVAVQHGAHISPDLLCSRLVLIIILDKRIGHIDAEAVAASVKPEPHDVLQRLTRRERVRRVDRVLPRLLRMKPAVVEGRLALEEIQHVRAVPLALAADVRMTINSEEPAVRPDIAAAVFIFLSLAAHLKPLMLLGRVARHEVEQHMHTAAVRLTKQLLEVLICPVARRDLLVIADVIARVLERRVKAGIDPERICAEVPDIVKLLRNTRNVPDSVRIRVAEGLRVDLIKYCIFKPFRHNVPPFQRISAMSPSIIRRHLASFWNLS